MRRARKRTSFGWFERLDNDMSHSDDYSLVDERPTRSRDSKVSVILRGVRPSLLIIAVMALVLGVPVARAETSPVDGQLYGPEGIAIGLTDDVYVTDYEFFLVVVDRVQKFTADGDFITKWGSQGSADGQFDLPMDIASDATGNVYVVDWGNYRVEKFSSNGVFITKWGEAGDGDGQFYGHPTSIATDATGNVYVGNYYEIQKFTSNGAFLARWVEPAGLGGGDIATDSAGNVYVADDESSLIRKFSADGTFITEWGSYGYGGRRALTRNRRIRATLTIIDTRTHKRETVPVVLRRG